MYKITDDKLIKCRFDLAFYYYLVSYYTSGVQHSSDKLPNANLHRYTDLKYTYNRWKYDSYNKWTLYKTMESRRL